MMLRHNHKEFSYLQNRKYLCGSKLAWTGEIVDIGKHIFPHIEFVERQGEMLGKGERKGNA